jgi:hypothetical protein
MAVAMKAGVIEAESKLQPSSSTASEPARLRAL